MLVLFSKSPKSILGTPMPENAREESRQDYLYFLKIPTRWLDVDRYHHVNNVVYYSYFDTIINEYLIGEGGFNPDNDAAIGVCAESQCCFRAEFTFPEAIEAGLRVGKLGNSSVRYEIGLFRKDCDAPAATGYFVHVFVDRTQRRSCPIPGRIRAALERLVR